MKELTFRDGDRTVPDHVEMMLMSVETWKYTYRDAMRIANEKMLLDELEKAQQGMLREHFKVTL